MSRKNTWGIWRFYQVPSARFSLLQDFFVNCLPKHDMKICRQILLYEYLNNYLNNYLSKFQASLC